MRRCFSQALQIQIARYATRHHRCRGAHIATGAGSFGQRTKYRVQRISTNAVAAFCVSVAPTGNGGYRCRVS